MLLSWGRKPLPVDLEGWSAERLSPPGGPLLAHPREALLDALDSPDGLPPLEKWLSGAGSVALVVSDAEVDFQAPVHDTVIETILAAGVEARSLRIVVATGLNRFRGWKGHALGRLRDIGQGDPVVHDPDDAAAVARVGEVGKSGTRSLVRGLVSEALRAASRQAPSPARAVAASAAGRLRPVSLNRAVTEADRIVCVSRIQPDSLLGYTGGATLIFPGLAARGSADSLEEMGMLSLAGPGRIDGNPAREDVDAACALLGDRVLSIDVLEAPGGGVLGIAAGTPAMSTRKIAPLAREALGAPCRPSPTVIAASASDRLESALMGGAVAATALSPGGTLVLAAECRRGMGSEARAARIVERFIAPRLGDGVLVMVSTMPPADVLRCGLRPARSMSTALELARERAGGEASAVVVPDAAATLPVPG